MRSREELFAMHIIDNKCTIRSCAEYFKISKSTVHNDISKKLYKRNKFLFYQVYKVIDVNLKERHIRGGIATQNKYRLLRMNK
jgi:putative DeoR family transcriptional regulator (stage III sporulation protein D)